MQNSPIVESSDGRRHSQHEARSLSLYSPDSSVVLADDDFEFKAKQRELRNLKWEQHRCPSECDLGSIPIESSQMSETDCRDDVARPENVVR